MIRALLLLLASAIAAPLAGQSTWPLGTHRMAIQCPGGELPFYLQLEADDEGGLAASIQNGSERIAVPRIEQQHGVMVLAFDHYDSELRLKVSADETSLSGEWLKRRGDGATTRMAVHSTPGKTRFRAATTPAASAPADWCVGRFAVTFSASRDQAVGLLRRADGRHHDLEGTFLTTLGDYRYLAGNVHGDDLALSCFDGAHAFLFHATYDRDANTIRGDFWSSDNWHETWTAVRDDHAALPDGFGLTTTRADIKLGDTRLEALDGTPRTLDDEGLRGTVRVVEIFGTWCPNCHDHGEYLGKLHRRYQDRGLQVVGIACEHQSDRDRKVRQVRAFAERHQTSYPIWLGGSSNKAETTRKLGFVDRVRAFPTTLFIDMQGKVRGVYQGWSGPAAGDAHERLVQRFEALVEQLLAER